MLAIHSDSAVAVAAAGSLGEGTADKGEVPMNERVIRTDGIELATQAFGDPGQPPVLLIMGAMASMLWWPDAFCERLAGQGRHVLRYDNRDTGHSTTYPPGEPPYAFDDMANDAVRVLDGHGISSAHLVGMSMGGMIAQLVALKHPARVTSLTAMSSSPFGEDTSGLPGTTLACMEHAAQFDQVDWTDRAQVIRVMVAESRMLAGSAHPFDEARATRLIERDFDRAGNFASVTNHFMLKGGAAWQGRLREIGAPLLVIHGTADPVFPIEHGGALSEAVAGAILVRLEGGGHELYEADWDEIIASIVEHTGR
jgi:pimeloyl-ACP methyl ester carboxylesterase